MWTIGTNDDEDSFAVLVEFEFEFEGLWFEGPGWGSDIRELEGPGN